MSSFQVIDDDDVIRVGAVAELAWYLIVTAGAAIVSGKMNRDAIKANAAEVRKDVEEYLSKPEFQE